jgi:hypothetical protein
MVKPKIGVQSAMIVVDAGNEFHFVVEPLHSDFNEFEALP